MKATLITVGIVLLVIGVIGLVYSYATIWMWVLAILGVVGIVWGMMTKKDEQQPMM